MINQTPYRAIIGFLFIVFSLVFFILLFERQYKEHRNVRASLDEYSIQKGFVEGDFLQLRQDVNSLNMEVNSMASDIGELIIAGSRINDTIVHFMNQAEANQETLDSLEYLENALEANDHQIDSLNQIFEKKSDSLMVQMRAYSDTELSLRILEVNEKNHGEDLWYIKLFMLIYLFFLALGLVSGIFLLLRGFK